MTWPRSPIRAPRFVALAQAVLGVCGVAHATTMPVDDTGTVTVQPTMNLRWQELSPRQQRGDLMEGTIQLRVRLNVKPWMGHYGRIYMVLPAQLPGDIAASWTTTGRLLPGRVQSGSRTLVFAGTIASPVLEDTLVLSLAVDGRQMRQTYNLQCRFEIDED